MTNPFKRATKTPFSPVYIRVVVAGLAEKLTQLSSEILSVPSTSGWSLLDEKGKTVIKKVGTFSPVYIRVVVAGP